MLPISSMSSHLPATPPLHSNVSQDRNSGSIGLLGQLTVASMELPQPSPNDGYPIVLTQSTAQRREVCIKLPTAPRLACLCGAVGSFVSNVKSQLPTVS